MGGVDGADRLFCEQLADKLQLGEEADGGCAEGLEAVLVGQAGQRAG